MAGQAMAFRQRRSRLLGFLGCGGASSLCVGSVIREQKSAELVGRTLLREANGRRDMGVSQEGAHRFNARLSERSSVQACARPSPNPLPRRLLYRRKWPLKCL